MSLDREAFVRSKSGTTIVALVLCLVCSAVVSIAAIGLRPQIEANKALKVKRNVLAAAGRWQDGYTEADVAREFESIETVLINLPRREDPGAEAGTPASDLAGDKYDPRKAAKDPKLSVEIPHELDIAKIKRREVAAPVYLVKDGGRISQYIFPVYGKGLWSTLYGFLALDADLRTVHGITFYEHAETPGLGGEVENPSWKAKWSRKIAIGPDGQPQIDVIKGTVGPGTPDADSKIDGLSGATITSSGVEGLVNYWLGADGFGPYIKQQQK